MTQKYFGTDGIRGTVGQAPITPDFVLRLAHAVGRVLKQTEERPTVLIGKDTRISGYMLESALESGFNSAGVDVVLLGPLPTPGVAYLTRAQRASLGVVISASHNAYPDNGIKFFSAQGTKLPDAWELAVEAALEEPPKWADSATLGKARRLDDAAGRYIEFCKSTFPSDLTLKGLKIVVDAAHGAAYQVAPKVFHELGAEVLAIGCAPDGVNINHEVGATHPDALVRAVRANHADYGIALAWRARPLPSRWWLLGLLVLTIGATLLTHRTLLGRDAGVTLLVVLLTLKTLELRARRDAFVVFFLSFFTMLTNFFFSQSLLTAAAMLVALMGLLTALVNTHMPVGKPPLREAAGIALTMAALGAPIMLVLFMLFPRLAPLWGVPSDAMAGRSGLSSTMEVGAIAELALDDSIAMRIRFEGLPPPQSELYFRGPVLSTLQGRQWQPLRSAFPPRMQDAAGLQVAGEPIRYQVTLEPNNRPWIFVLDAAQDAPDARSMSMRMSAQRSISTTMWPNRTASAKRRSANCRFPP